MASRLLHLVRHGDAAGEKGSLTAAGQEQARLTGARLAAAIHPAGDQLHDYRA
jgi:broad specificity phosphatase PhoE